MKVIVFGADGTIGSALARTFELRRDVVYGTTRRSASVDGTRLFLDFANRDVETTALPAVDIAFFCAAIVSYAECRANQALARRVNVTSPATLARRLASAGTRVVLLSTSAVFNGREPRVPADRSPCPTTAYGEFAAEAEKEFSALGEAAAVVRLTKLITPDAKRFTNWIDALSRHQAVVAFSDHHMSPIASDDVTSALLAITDQSASGICQISGATDISYYEAVCHIAARLGVDPALVVEERALKAGIRPEEIAQYSSLDARRFTELTGRSAPDAFSIIDTVFAEHFREKKIHNPTLL